MATTFMAVFLTMAHLQTAAAETTFSSPESCRLTGDDDVYGIGIRLSLYLQWFTLLIATWCSPDDARFARTFTNIVTIAVLANAFKNTGNSSVVLIEWWIVIFNTFSLQLGNIPFSKRLIRGSASNLGTMMILWSAIIVANCWVWFAGVDLGRKEGCDIKIYFFHPVSIYNHAWQSFLRVLAAMSCAVALFFLVTGCMAIGWTLTTSDEEDEEEEEEEEEEDEDDEKQSMNAAALSTVFQILIGIVAISETEMTIEINDIQMKETLQSSGQLIPFVIGIFSLLATVGAGIRNVTTANEQLPVQIQWFKERVRETQL
jgi:hypothetical protein